MRRWAQLVVLSVAAATSGCAAPAADVAPAVTPTPSAQQVAPPRRVDAAADLSNFGCLRRRDGRWRASGTITNSAHRPAAYTVKVVIAGAAMSSAEGKQRTFRPVQPGATKAFVIKGLRAPVGTAPTCSVQVARLR